MTTVAQFDPAAEFLLDMPWHNLFESACALPTSTKCRCKGCGEIIDQHERERHFRKHLRLRDRQERNRQKRIRDERVKRLARARSMRGQA